MLDPSKNSPAHKPPETSTLALQAALMLAVVYGSYALLWRDWGAFSLAIDQRRWLFNDFRFHFYPMAAGILETRRPSDGFYYSAFFAVLLRPFAWLPLDVAARLWGGLQVLLFAALCLLPLRGLLKLPRHTALLCLLLCSTSYPALSNFKWGQVSVLLTLLTLASFDAAWRGRSLLAGVLLAVAASIKYYSGFFLLLFFFRRDGRAVLAFLAAGAVCFVLVPASLLGPSDWIEFHRAAFAALADAQWVAGDPNSQYLAHVVLRWANGFSGAPAEVPAGLRAAGLALALPAVAGAWSLRRATTPLDLALAVGLLFTALPCLVTTSWPHYFVHLPFVQVVALRGLAEIFPHAPIRRRLLVAPVAVSIAVASLPFFLLFPSWLAYQEKGFLLIADLLLLPPLLALAFRRPPLPSVGSEA